MKQMIDITPPDSTPPTNLNSNAELPIAADNRTVWKRMDILNKVTLAACELTKLAAIYNIASGVDSTVAAAFLYGASSLYQASIIKDQKQKSNIDALYEGEYWLYDNEKAVPKPVSYLTETLKSIIPGRPLSFLKKPKL